MITCLNNLIGVRYGCADPTTPSSGLWLDDFLNQYGITLKQINSGIHEEFVDGLDAINKAIEFAQEQIKNDIYRFAQPKFKQKSLIESKVVGFFKDDLKAVALEAGQYKGIRVRVEDYDYLQFFISRFTLQVNTTQNVDIKVFDLISGTLLDTFTVAAVANVPTQVIVNKSYNTNKQRLNLFIGYESNIGTFETDLGANSSGCIDCFGSYSNKYVSFSAKKISTGATMTDINLKSITGTAGLSMDYSINCSLENFVCQMANIIAFPMLFKVGENIVNQIKYSKRLNSIVTIYGGKNDELAKFLGEQYDTRMGELFSSMQLPCDVCFECQTRIKTGSAIP